MTGYYYLLGHKSQLYVPQCILKRRPIACITRICFRLYRCSLPYCTRLTQSVSPRDLFGSLSCPFLSVWRKHEGKINLRVEDVSKTNIGTWVYLLLILPGPFFRHPNSQLDDWLPPVNATSSPSPAAGFLGLGLQDLNLGSVWGPAFGLPVKDKFRLCLGVFFVSHTARPTEDYSFMDPLLVNMYSHSWLFRGISCIAPPSVSCLHLFSSKPLPAPPLVGLRGETAS